MNTTDNTTPQSLQNVLEDAIVVADTSALLIRGVDLLRSLPQCKLIVPAIVVSELEGKRINPNVGFLAREWLRLLELLRQKHGAALATGVLVEGVHNVKKEIFIQIEPNHTNQMSLPEQLRNGSNDSTILAVAVNLQKEFSDKKVALISNDVPMRIHSTLEVGIDAYEINSTIIDDAKPFDGVAQLKITDEELDALTSDMLSLAELKDLDRDGVLENSSHALIEIISSGESFFGGVKSNDTLLDIGSHKASRISGKTIEQKVALQYLLESPSRLPIVSIGGSAGTGKTLLTIAAGLDDVQRGRYQKVLVFRSLHEMGMGQEMGFLPGTIEDKIAPWAGAVFDAVDVIARKIARKDDPEKVKAEADKLKMNIEVSPITYLRGRSISNTFMVLDEAQNFSRNELLNILSRAGEGTKVVFCSDSAQVDNRFLQTGARAEIWSVIDSLRRSHLFAHVTLTQTERSQVAELASSILAQ